MLDFTNNFVYFCIFTTCISAIFLLFILIDVWTIHRNLQIKIIWTFIIIFIPIIGSMLYFYLNQNRPYYEDYESID